MIYFLTHLFPKYYLTSMQFIQCIKSFMLQLKGSDWLQSVNQFTKKLLAAFPLLTLTLHPVHCLSNTTMPHPAT